MGWDDDLSQAMRLMERVRRKSTDGETIDLCDWVLRLIQRDAMTGRGVPEAEQEKVLSPEPSAGSEGTGTPWGKAGVSKATWYRNLKKASEAKGEL